MRPPHFGAHLMRAHAQVEVERWPKSSAEKEKAGSAGGAAGEQQPKGGEAEGQQDAAGTAEAAAAAGAKGEGGGKEVMERPPDALAVLLQPKAGPHEVWNAVLQVNHHWGACLKGRR